MSNELMDYYYSQEQERVCREIAASEGRHHTKSTFKGKVFSECVCHGEKITSNFGDFIFIGTGTSKECTYS